MHMGDMENYGIISQIPLFLPCNTPPSNAQGSLLKMGQKYPKSQEEETFSVKEYFSDLTEAAHMNSQQLGRHSKACTRSRQHVGGGLMKPHPYLRIY